MAKIENMSHDADIIECLPNSMFRIRLDNGHEAIAHISGKMRQKSIRVTKGDRVKVEFSVHDAKMEKARIVFRYKK